MGKAHLELLKTQLEASKWKILPGYDLDLLTDHWLICRPNGDSQLKINFIIGGNGKYGALSGNETMYDALSCSVENHPHIDIYFGKYSKQFQIDIIEFINRLNALDKK